MSFSAARMASRPSVVWVFMTVNSSSVSLPGLSRIASDADLADVVQRRRLVEHLHRGVVQLRTVGRVRLQVLRQRAYVVLRAPDVVAGLVVARLGERGHRHDGYVLHDLDLARALRDL